MNNLVEVAIGIGVVGAVAGIAYVASKKERPLDIFDEDKKSEDGIFEEDQEKETPKKEDTVFTKIKKSCIRVGLKFLLWVSEHQEQIEALGTLIGLGVGIFNIISAARDFIKGNEMQKKVDDLVNEKDAFKEAWNNTQSANEADMNTLMEEFKDIKSMLKATKDNAA